MKLKDNIIYKIKEIINIVKNLDKEYIVVGIIIISVIIFGIVKSIGKGNELNNNNFKSSNSFENELTESITSSLNINKDNKNIDESSNKNIFVHIDGAVKNPGVYELNENARLNELIQKAGDVTSDANTKSINLATILTDGSKIYIPFSSEESGDNNELTNTETKDGISIKTNNSNSKEVLNTSNLKTTNNNILKDKININKANASDLMKINGIGESTANKILDYREHNGKFNSIEEIKEVKGIGEAKFKNIQNYITVRKIIVNNMYKNN